MVQNLSFSGRFRQEVALGDAKQYIDVVRDESRSILLRSGCNVDQTRGGSPKNTTLRKVIVDASTKPETITVLEEKTDA
jgi:hypothetical protein